MIYLKIKNLLEGVPLEQEKIVSKKKTLSKALAYLEG
jgi:hypothetical protein